MGYSIGEDGVINRMPDVRKQKKTGKGCIIASTVAAVLFFVLAAVFAYFAYVYYDKYERQYERRMSNDTFSEVREYFSKNHLELMNLHGNVKEMHQVVYLYPTNGDGNIISTEISGGMNPRTYFKYFYLDDEHGFVWSHFIWRQWPWQTTTFNKAGNITSQEYRMERQYGEWFNLHTEFTYDEPGRLQETVYQEGYDSYRGEVAEEMIAQWNFDYGGDVAVDSTYIKYRSSEYGFEEKAADVYMAKKQHDSLTYISEEWYGRENREGTVVRTYYYPHPDYPQRIAGMKQYRQREGEEERQIGKWNFEYDQNSDIIKFEVKDRYRDTAKHWTFQYTSYDNQGNWTSRSEYLEGEGLVFITKRNFIYY